MENENEYKEFKRIDTDKIEDYNFAGVWAMFGYRKNNSDNSAVCLNVGKTKCIKEELQADITRIKGIKKNKPKEYRNQFGKKIFEYNEYPQRIDFIYDDINKKYEKFFWILVSQENDYWIEKYFAYSFKAIYWVANGQYKNEVADEEIEKIRQEIDTSKFPKGLTTRINNLKNRLIKTTHEV